MCRLWPDNDEREYRFTQAAIAEAVRNRETREERIIMLAGRLEDFMKVNAPDLGANVWGDVSARRRPPRGPEVYRAETTEEAGCLSGLVRSARMPVSPEEI